MSKIYIRLASSPILYIHHINIHLHTLLKKNVLHVVGVTHNQMKTAWRYTFISQLLLCLHEYFLDSLWFKNVCILNVY